MILRAAFGSGWSPAFAAFHSVSAVSTAEPYTLRAAAIPVPSSVSGSTVMRPIVTWRTPLLLEPRRPAAPARAGRPAP